MGAPPSNQYRIEVLEKGLNEMRSTVVEQISAAVTGASLDLQQTLSDRLSKAMDLAIQRLDDKVTKSKELQDSLLNQLRLEQSKFQDEVRLTLAGLKTGGPEGEGDFS